ncbi:MAG: amino acid-binding protein, partial [Halapricum sp.]
VTVDDAEDSGIVAAVTGAISDRDITIRQVISDDPEFSDQAQLYLITDEALPGDLINEIRDLDFVRKIEIQ